MNSFNGETNTQEVKYIDIHDLSIVEITTLNYLANHRDKILRFDLYKKINSLLRPFKKLSTSSFYNSLQKMGKRGYLQFSKIDNKDPKSLAVEPVPVTERILGFIYYYFTQYSLSIREQPEQTMDIFEILSGRQEFNSVLVIDPETSSSTQLIASIIPNAAETIKAIAHKSKKVFLLSTEELFDYYSAEGVDNIVTSQTLEGNIREPDNFFDLIIFPLYDSNLLYNNMNFYDILREAKRLLHTDGTLILISLEPLVEQNNQFIKHYTDSLNLSGYFISFEPDELLNKLGEIGFSDTQLMVKHGLNYIMARP